MRPQGDIGLALIFSPCARRGGVRSTHEISEDAVVATWRRGVMEAYPIAARCHPSSGSGGHRGAGGQRAVSSLPPHLSVYNVSHEAHPPNHTASHTGKRCRAVYSHESCFHRHRSVAAAYVLFS